MRLDFNFKHDKVKDLVLLFSNIYLPLLGLLWICFHIYIRFILERSSYTLNEFKEYVSLKQSFMFLVFVIVHIIIIIIALIIIIKRKTGYKQNTNFIKISILFSNILSQIYWKPLEYLHDKIAPYIPGSGRFFLYLETKWKTKRFTYIVIGLFDVFPKIIVSLIFFVETIFFQRIHIFLYSLMLLIFPIFFSIFLKLFFSFTQRNVPLLKEYFESIKGISDPVYDNLGNIAYYDTYEVIVKPEYVAVINPQEEMELLLQLRRIVDIVVFTKETLNAISPYVLFIISSLYLAGGSYRLFYFLS